MSTGEHDHETSASTTIDEAAQAGAAAGAPPEGEEPEAEAKPKLELEVQITDSGPCKKHVKVAVSRADIERQFNDSIGELKREAMIPGFRPGHAPKQLVQKRFRKEVGGQVKSALLLASMEQLDKDYKINPIAQPEIDVEAIELPETGPMRFEVDIEVEPDFTLPDYKSLTVKRPVKTLTDADVEAQLQLFLERYAQLVPKLEGGAELGDFVTADLRFDRDGVVVNEAKEIQFRLQPELRFQDGHVPGLADALLGAKPGDLREANAEIGMSSPDPAIRGRTIRVTFNVLDLKRLRLPEVNTAFLQGIGFDSLEDLRTALREVLDRRLQFQQRQAVRRAILQKLVEQTAFDLPADLVARQEKATLRRQVLEMRKGGMSDAEIRAREAEVRANTHATTLTSLKEFFILSK
ncbi:MAG TPA: trigger factor, partial [Isosphaeraceae bacterium]|nr:trigger factor [Isosphaeraceae bacterium]